MIMLPTNSEKIQTKSYSRNIKDAETIEKKILYEKHQKY